MAFRLQQLPSLALHEITMSMELCDVLLLTQTSFRMKKMIRRVTKKISVHLDIIDTEDQKTVVCHRLNNNSRNKILELPILISFTAACRSQAKFGTKIKPVVSIGGLQNTFDNGYPDAFIAIIDNFVEVTDLRSVSLKICDTKGKDSIKILEHVRIQDVTIDRLEWQVECDYSIGMLVVKACVNVKEKLLITAPWITIHQVLSLRNVPDLELITISLTNQHLNRIIHECSDIKRWKVWGFRDFNPDIIFKNLEVNRRGRYQTNYQFEMANGKTGYVDFEVFSMVFSTIQRDNIHEVIEPRFDLARMLAEF